MSKEWMADKGFNAIGAIVWKTGCAWHKLRAASVAPSFLRIK